MPRTIGAAIGADTARLLIGMIARIPSVDRHVDSAAKGDIIIDHHHLLMMRPGRRMMAIKPHMDLWILYPFGDAQQRSPMEQSLDRARIPPQNIDIQPRRPFDQPAEKGPDAHRRPVIFPITKADSCVKIPSDQQDLLARLQHRGPRRLEIIIGVDDDLGPAGMFNPPAIAVRIEQSLVHTPDNGPNAPSFHGPSRDHQFGKVERVKGIV